ncbi:hypothetical protein B0H14DRAFT_1278731 [Mycena olivaceomarginata]|nr:hypothetical protein B0H14DRAFT_1278731 [Mycena olivaceomarginata]
MLKERKTPTPPRRDCEWQQLVYLNGIQQQLADMLERELSAKSLNFDEKTAADAYRNFLREIYFPSSTIVKEALQTFTSPVAVFLALACIGDQNGYAPIWPISCIAAKVQFLMRLRAIHCWTAERDPNADATEWFESVPIGSYLTTLIFEKNNSKPFCRLYLTEDTFTPYATVRHWMHLFTARLSALPRPYRIQWKSQRVMLFDGKEVDIDRYFGFVRQELQDLEEFVQKEVLFGISLAELNIDCDPVELRMASTGGPLLTGDCAIGLDNPQSNRFASALFAGSYLGPEGQHGGNSIQIDPTKGVHWVNKIGNTMQRLHPISHVTQGLPGRGSEESLLSQSNIDVELEHHTLGFQASHLKTNVFKHIFRMLTPRVSKLLYNHGSYRSSSGTARPVAARCASTEM